jgi:hypothetical protein
MNIYHTTDQQGKAYSVNSLEKRSRAIAIISDNGI